MAEGGFVGASAGNSISPASSVTYYGNFGNSVIPTATLETVEANAALVYRGPGATLKNLRVVVATNGRGTASTITTRKNGAGAGQSVSLTATGTYTDLTNTVTLAAGDTFGYQLVVGGTSGALSIWAISANSESAGQAATFWSTLGLATTATANATRYYIPIGNLASAQATEIAGQAVIPAAGVFSNLRVVASTARATATTVRTRINGANGNQSVSVTAAGTYEDVTNSDTVAAGDRITIASVTSTGTDTLSLVNLSLLFTPSTARLSAIASAPASSSSLTTGVTRYLNPLGQLGFSSAEAGSQIPAPAAGVASYFCCAVSANASTTDVTAVLRVAGADTALTFVIPAGATGVFADTTHSVAIAAGALIAAKFSGATGTVTLRSAGLAFTTDLTPVTAVGIVTLTADVVAQAGTVGVVTQVADVVGQTASQGAITLAADFVPSSVTASQGTVTLGATVVGVTASQGTINLEADVQGFTGKPRRYAALL